MSIAHARALLPAETIVQEHDPAADARALWSLARWAMRFTPMVQADPPTGLLLDVTGCDRLFGGEQRLLNLVLRELSELGFTASAAIGPTVGSVWAVARYGSGRHRGTKARRHAGIIDEADLPDVLTGLPVAALRVDEAIVTGLADVGITRIGEVLELGREAVADRFGEELLLRLDQAMGSAFEGVEGIRPWEPVQVSRTFEGPVKQLAGVEQTVRELVEVLCDELERREAGVRRLVLAVERIDTSDLTDQLRLSRPSRDAAHLWRLLRPRVERLHLGYGVERITLHAATTGRLAHRQNQAWAADESQQRAQREMEADVAALVDQLVERLGGDRVMRMEAVENYVPERAFVRRSVQEAGLWSGEDTTVVEADRPTVLFERAEEVEVLSLSPDGPVASIRFRGGGVSGMSGERRVVMSVGPERITPRWWLSEPGRTPLPRDYFKVQDEAGCWWWLYRKADTSRWFVQGEWV